MHQKQKYSYCLRANKKNPKYWELSWAIKMEYCIFEKVNNSIATKLCTNLLNNFIEATFLFAMLYFFCISSFGVSSCFPGFMPNPWFLRQNPRFLCWYPVLPMVLRGVPRMVCGGGGPCVARRHPQPLMWCYPGKQFNLPAQSLIMGPVSRSHRGMGSQAPGIIYE